MPFTQISLRPQPLPLLPGAPCGAGVCKLVVKRWLTHRCVIKWWHKLYYFGAPLTEDISFLWSPPLLLCYGPPSWRLGASVELPESGSSDWWRFWWGHVKQRAPAGWMSHLSALSCTHFTVCVCVCVCVSVFIYICRVWDLALKVRTRFIHWPWINIVNILKHSDIHYLQEKKIYGLLFIRLIIFTNYFYHINFKDY